MASQQEIQQIITNFLLNAPPGEFMEVVTDIRGLLKNDAILNSLAPTVFKQYNTDQMLKVKTPYNTEFLITKHGEVSANEYLDPATKQIVTFDHIRQEITGARSAGNALDSDVEPYRKAFETQVAEYVKEHFENGAGVVYGAKNNDGTYTVTTCISAVLLNPNNFYTGRWRSLWTCTFKPGSGNAELKGNIRITVHYYEDGNVQLNTNTPKVKQVQGSDANSLAAAAVKALSASESEFHNALDASYNSMGTTTFKALRRALPITRKKIEWNKVLTMKMDIGKN